MLSLLHHLLAFPPDLFLAPSSSFFLSALLHQFSFPPCPMPLYPLFCLPLSQLPHCSLLFPSGIIEGTITSFYNH